MPKRKRKPPREPAPATRAPDGYAEWEASLTPQERRVDEIVQKMQSGAWLAGVSERALAKEWRCAPDTVRKLAAEASRALRRELRTSPGALEEARAAVLQTFEVIRAKAMAKGDAQALRVALDATRALGFYMGVEPPKQLDIGKRHDPFEGWSPQELLAYAEEGPKARRALKALAELPVEAPGDDDERVH